MVCYNLYVRTKDRDLWWVSSFHEYLIGPPARAARSTTQPVLVYAPGFRRGENPITTNRSGPAYAIFGPLAAMIRCQTYEFRATFPRHRSSTGRSVGRFHSLGTDHLFREFWQVRSIYTSSLSLSFFFLSHMWIQDLMSISHAALRLPSSEMSDTIEK